MNTDKTNYTRKILSLFLRSHFSKKTEEEVQRWFITNKNKETKKEVSFDYWNSIELETDAKTMDALKKFNLKYNHKWRKKNIFDLSVFKKIAAIFIPVMILSGAFFYYNYTLGQLTEWNVGLGETQLINLSDGSQMWINSGSKVKYSKRFGRKQRFIYLDGEAYFSVHPDQSRPFIVQTANLSVEVVGTEFNIKAYAGDPYVSTILDRGEIIINTPKNESYTLKPKEQLRYNIAEDEVVIWEVSETGTTNWMTGALVFTNEPLLEILKTVERRFDVTIDTSEIDYNQYQDISVKFVQNENLNDVLEVLTELTGNITYQKENNRIILIITNK